MHSNSTLLQALAVLERSRKGSISFMPVGLAMGGGEGGDGQASQQSSSQVFHFQNHIYGCRHRGLSQQNLQVSEG